MARSASASARSVVWLEGDHDASTWVSLRAAFARIIELDDADVLVDLAGVSFMDASTVGVIVGACNRLRVASRSLELRSPSPAALQVLRVCGWPR